MDNLFGKIHPDLPIFTIPWGENYIVYTPGSIVKVASKNMDSLTNALVTGVGKNEPCYKEASSILQNARTACESWQKLSEQDFKPECLTVYLSNSCNYNCDYCYSRSTIGSGKSSTVSMDAVMASANYVITNCIQKNKPFVLVLHGGGEPTFHWDLFVNIFTKVRDIVAKSRLEFYSYVATNGDLNQDRVAWIARNFSLTGLSCDGPPDINEAQRKGSLKGSLRRNKIVDTVRIIREEGGKYDIRSTITKHTLTQQVQIVRYLMDELCADTIRFEPEFLNSQDPFNENDATIFVENFLRARQLAIKQNVQLSYSGVRLNEIHHTYCDLNRNNLRINPENQYLNCFCDTDEKSYQIGEFNLATRTVRLNHHISKTKEAIFQIDEACEKCINIYHCSRGCPDFCSLSNDLKLNRFRCRLNSKLAVEMIKRQASLQ